MHRAMSERRFHHGNLRADLLALAAQRIEETGHEALSLRELAAALGVSPAAPYRHFASKDELLQAVAIGAVEELRLAYLDAMAAEASPMARFRMACRSYLDLGERRPQAFRLLFMSENYLQPGKTDEPQPSYALFVDLAAEAFGLRDRHAAEIAALASWSTLHGFVVIRMDSRVSARTHDAETLEAVLDRACGVNPA